MKKTQSNNNRKVDKKYLVILAVFVVAAVLLGVSLGIYLGTEGGGDSLPAWITIVVIILLVALPLLLISLLFAVLSDKKAASFGMSPVLAETESRNLQEGADTAAPVKRKKGEAKTRFDGLTRIDERRASFSEEKFEDGVGLAELCDEFRNFAAGSLRSFARMVASCAQVS